MWTKDDTGSIIAEDGKVIWFSQERFIRDIALGNCCFICGVSPEKAEFNDEHILPEWLLRRYNLFSKTIGLPNGKTVRYGGYTLPCCASCNSLMGRKVETPISKLTAEGRDAVRQALRAYRLPFFVWLGLIYLKTHLKDRSFRYHLDERKGGQKIADAYHWLNLHHIHSVVRCFFADAGISSEVVGSFLFLRIASYPGEGAFDFGDLYQAQTIVLRMDDMAFVTAFGDAGCTLHYFKDKLLRMNGPLSSLQLREVVAELAAIRLHMKRPPTFRSLFDLEAKSHWIYADRVDYTLRKWRPEVRGKLLHHSMQSFGPRLVFTGRTTKDALKLVKAGKLTFLFDDSGNFLPAGERQQGEAMATPLSAAAKAARTRKLRAAGKKAAKKRKQNAAGAKAALTKRRKAAAKKAWATRRARG